jgi:hypothetical protein
MWQKDWVCLTSGKSMKLKNYTKQGFLLCRVKYHINGDFVENPQNECKTCGKHHIAYEYQEV